MPQKKASKITVYLTGPIGDGSGREQNIQRFHSVASTLRGKEGYYVVSPVEINHAGAAQWRDYMKNDIKAMLECDAVYCLKGWEKSPGARLEVFIALQLGMDRLDERIE